MGNPWCDLFFCVHVLYSTGTLQEFSTSVKKLRMGVEEKIFTFKYILILTSLLYHQLDVKLHHSVSKVKFKFMGAASLSAVGRGVKSVCGHRGVLEEEMVVGGWVVPSL